MMARIRKPCPGCGEVDRSRPADRVCHACTTLILEAKQWREKTRARTDKKPYRYGSMAWYQMGDYHEWESSLEKHMLQLVDVIAERVPECEDSWGYRKQGVFSKHDGELPTLFSTRHNTEEDGRQNKVGLFDPKVATALNALDVHIRNLLINIAEAAEEKGRSLLLQLNDGSLGMKDFEEKVMKNDSYRWQERADIAKRLVEHKKEVEAARKILQEEP